MPASSHLSSDNLLRFLQVRNAPATPEEIAAGLRLRKTERRGLHKMLSKLKSRRLVEEIAGQRYRLPSRRPEGDPKPLMSGSGAKQPGPSQTHPGVDSRPVAAHRGTNAPTEVTG